MAGKWPMELLIEVLGESAKIQNILFVLLGTFLGLFAGAMPGLSANTAIALLLPFCFRIPVASTIFMLMPLYIAVEYSNAIPAVTLA